MKPLRLGAFSALLLTLAAFGGRRVALADRFDHWEHRKLFPSCTSCHAGALEPDRPLYPTADGCASCHDGTVEKRVEWNPPGGPRVSNLRFTHRDHAGEIARNAGRDSTVACVACHAEQGAPWMQVAGVATSRCLSCHGINTAHYSAPDTACATCHLWLAEAKKLPAERIAKFEAPESHKQPGFDGRGHGRLAEAVSPVSPSCATCHARDFCAQCHVNASRVPTIAALAPDRRSLAIEAKLAAPSSHTASRFEGRHGDMSRKADASCANCHTQESCIACHRASPAVAASLPAAEAGLTVGAPVERHRPASHTTDFADRHGPAARSRPSTCNACHARTECFDCHRPNPGGADSYHPAGFLNRHPSAAYARQTDCSDCHNPGSFCTSCHTQSGFRSNGGILASRFHDSQNSFLLNHGQAARQTIESCVTCHSEADCLACHSARTRRFNPHGPGFDPDRLKKKNPQTCAACHGRAIP